MPFGDTEMIGIVSEQVSWYVPYTTPDTIPSAITRLAVYTPSVVGEHLTTIEI